MTRYDTDDLTVIDFAAHCHVYPDGVSYDAVDAELERPVYRDVDEYARYYEEAGIDGAVLSQTPFMGGDVVEEVRAANDALREGFVDRDTYFGLASLPTAAGGTEAAAEFERCLDAGFNGAGIETESGSVEIHDEKLDPVLEVANRTGAPLFVHPKLDDSVGADRLDDAWLLNAVLGRDAALCSSLVTAIHTGVLDRFPDLNLVYHHLGGNVASALGRFHNQYEKFSPEGWMGEDPGEPFKEYPEFLAQLEERIYVDTSGYYGYPGPLRNALEVFPTSQLLFGTDFPFETRTHEDFDDNVYPVIDQASRRDASAILGSNTLDLLVNVD